MKSIRWTAGFLGVSSAALLLTELALRAVFAYRRWLWAESQGRFEDPRS